MSQQVKHNTLVDSDGYTITRYLDGVQGLYGPLRFTYRPVTAAMRAELNDVIKNQSNAQTFGTFCKALAKQLVDWTATSHDGKDVAITKDGVASLHPALSLRLVDVVLWSVSPGDIDPDQIRKDESGKSWLDAPSDQELEQEAGN